VSSIGRSSDIGRKRGVDMDITETPRWASGKLVDLPLDECTLLLAERLVGRVAWTGPAGPTVLPINHVVAPGHGRVTVRSRNDNGPGTPGSQRM
jgi:hypothetical protein